ncbi:unnamed protein product [Alopecurus aequalis]
MDDAEEIPEQVHPEKPCVDAGTQGHSTTQAVAVTKVLDDDNLLREIIVRVALPNTLVRAALVCKRWLEHASDRKFLSRFHQLHPPRLLGYYKYDKWNSFEELYPTHFVPMLPQPPELATIIRRLESYNFGARKIVLCQDGSIFTSCREGENWILEVHRPLCPKRHTQIIPPLPHVHEWNWIFSQIISKEEGSNMSYLYVSGEATEETRELTTNVYMLQDGEWRLRTSATCPHGLHEHPIAVRLLHNKIYMPSAITDDIFVLDLMTSNFSAIQPPQGVKYSYRKSMLSQADDASSVYLFDVKWFQLHVWLHKGDNWLLVDSFCLHDMLDTLGMPSHILENEGNYVKCMSTQKMVDTLLLSIL